MKYLAAYILTILLSFAMSLFFPWWIIAVAASLVAVVIPQKPGKAFAIGFVAVFTLWGVSAFIIDMQNEQVLSSRVAAVLPLGGVPAYLILATAVVGGLVGGFAALTGSLLRNLFMQRKTRNNDPVELERSREVEAIHS
jgi:hypothetical protein